MISRNIFYINSLVSLFPTIKGAGGGGGGSKVIKAFLCVCYRS